MRILIAGQAYYRRDNGQAVFTVNLAEGLAAEGHEVLVVAPSERGRAYCTEVEGVALQTVPAVHLGHNVNVTAFANGLVLKRMHEFDPDVVHIQDHYFLSQTVLKAARKLGVTVVGTNHFLPENLTDNFRVPHWLRGVVHRWLWWTVKRVYGRLAMVTTPTDTAVAILRQQLRDVPLRAVSCGVDLERFRPRGGLDWSKAEEGYRLDPHKNILFYVGRVDREKGIDIIIRALAHLNRKDVQFVVAGKGSHLASLRRLARELQLEEQVQFTGFVPDEDLPLLHNSVDAFVMPSHAELQSIATLEAMASGLPVIAANARALPELVQPGENGFLFEPGDVVDAARAIEQLLAHEPDWLRMGEVSMAKSYGHSLHRMVSGYEAVYERVCGVGEVMPLVLSRQAGD